MINGQLTNAEVFFSLTNISLRAPTIESHPIARYYFILRRIKMEGPLRIKDIHVAGTRMITQGTGGLYRGLMMGGVISGEDILKFLTLHLSTLKQLDNIL